MLLELSRGATLAPKTIEEFGGRFGTMASAFGNNIWQILALILCMCILIFGVGAGIEKAIRFNANFLYTVCDPWNLRGIATRSSSGISIYFQSRVRRPS